MASSSADAPFVDALRRCGQASGKLNDDQKKELGAVCEVVKEALVRRAQSLVSSCLGLPMLSSKSCDGTPLRVAYRTKVAAPALIRKGVEIRGRQGVEVLVANQFLRVHHPEHGWQTAVLLREPTRLSHGKKAAAILAAAHQGWKTLRELGHQGCIVEHYVWDRAGLSALERQTKEWHLSQGPLPESETITPEAQELLEIVVVTPCALHDSQNAFRWGFLPQCQDRQLMRDLYITVESLRNSSDLLSSRICTWILERLAFADGRGMEWEEEQTRLWTVLGIEPDVVDLLVSQLQLCWQGGRLWVKTGAKVCLGFTTRGQQQNDKHQLFSQHQKHNSFHTGVGGIPRGGRPRPHRVGCWGDLSLLPLQAFLRESLAHSRHIVPDSLCCSPAGPRRFSRSYRQGS